MRCHLVLAYIKIKTLLTVLVALSCLLLLNKLIRHRQSVLHSVALHRHVQNLLQFDDNRLIPGRFLENNVPANQSYCAFRYGLPWQLKYAGHDLKSTPQLGELSGFRVLYNVIEAKDNLTGGSVAPVTYATHVTPEYVFYISEIARYWEGFISVAIFAPEFDGDIVIKQLDNMCHCLPEMSRVSVHLVFPETAISYVEKRQQVADACTVPDISHIETFRQRRGIQYPVNICRNVARFAAITEHVLVSDVELIPSRNLASRFAAMTERLKKIDVHQVYVLPVFEVDKEKSIPRNKKELIELMKVEKVVYFHRYVCSHCQKFPGLQKWVLRLTDRVVKPFTIVKREFPFHRWEPVYIGTKSEPFFAEALSWEGKQDKMSQMLEMCLIGYKFVILDGAFLVHWPGIKRKTSLVAKTNWRKPHEQQNSRQYDLIIKGFASKYVENPKCKMQ